MIKDVSLIFDIPIYKGTLLATAELLAKWICEDKYHQHIVTANSEILYKTKSDIKLKRILQRASLVTADGMGVVWASKILGDPVPERVGGYDLMHALLELLDIEKRSIYLLGAKPEVIPSVAFEIKRLYPEVVIKGYHHGYFKNKESEVLEEIKVAEPDVLLVCLGAPQQEYWLNENLPNLPVKIAIGLGGSFDTLGGVKARAPESWQKAGMEWAFHLIKEPRRIGRMTALPKFAATIWKERIFKRH